MIHLGTFPLRGQYRVLWKDDSTAVPMDQLTEMLFVRLVAGVAWGENTHYTCVVGERLLERKSTAERYWVALDESQDNLAQPLFRQLVGIKDAYRLQTVYAPDNPTMLVEALRRTDGLAHYRDERYALAEETWPTFQDFDVVAGIHTQELPDEERIHHDLEGWLTEPVYDPESMAPMTTSQDKPLRRLALPADAQTSIIRSALEQATLVPCQALWLALSNLERRRPTVRRPQHEEAWEHRPGRGGY